MDVDDDENRGFGLLGWLRSRGFWFCFSTVSLVVFILLTAFDFLLPYLYGQDQPGFNLNLAWDLGINLVVGLLTGGFAWKYNGKPWINRPDTTKLDFG